MNNYENLENTLLSARITQNYDINIFSIGTSFQNPRIKSYIMMIEAIHKAIILSCFLILASSYSLETTWQLRTSEISELKKINYPIYFQFFKQQIDNGNQLQGILTITACQVLTYYYEVRNAEIILTFTRSGRTLRSCQNQQVVFLRTLLDQIFYFYISYKSLLFLSPNGESSIKLDIPQRQLSPLINGVWQISDNAANNKINDSMVVINGSQIAFCGGKVSFGYKIVDRIKVSLNLIKNDTNCNWQILKKFSQSTKFIRVNLIDSPLSSTFFDENVSSILSIRYISDYLMNKLINFDGILTQKGSNISNYTTPLIGSNTTINSSTSNVLNKSSSIATSTLNITNNITIINNTTSRINSINNSSQTNSSISNSTVSPTLKTSNNTQKASLPQSNSQNSTITAFNQPTPFELVKNSTQFSGVWYPSVTTLPNSLSEAELKKYQIIINPARILLNGGCNNAFSSYSITSGALSSLKLVSPAGKCLVDKDFILKSIIFSASNLYYISFSGKNPTIQIRSPKGDTLLILTQNAPK